MKQTRKDIFGNIYTVNTSQNKPMNFEQKLRETKAKQKYKQYQQEQRAKQVASIKQTAQRSKQGLQKIKSRVSDKRLPSLRDKLRGSIYKKE